MLVVEVETLVSPITRYEIGCGYNSPNTLPFFLWSVFGRSSKYVKDDVIFL